MTISQHTLGVTNDGATIERYTLANANGLEADIMTYGGTLMALRVPDRSGTPGDVVLGFETLAPYLDEHPFFGSTIGRYGNRIARGRFELNGSIHTLACNDGPNHLHGGPNGFHRRIWSARGQASDGGPSLELTYLSRDGEEGYPGNLSVTVTYTLTERDELRIDYTAVTDRDTVIKLTNHTYFNLAGGGDILAHELELPASQFLPIDATLIPLGELRPVRLTPMDFTAPTPIGLRIATADEQIRRGLGYDHTWVLDKQAGMLGRAAWLSDPASGRVIEVSTTEPAVQFYAGNLLDGSLTGKGGQRYAKHSGLCLETQHFPDSPNQPQFPSTVLRPDEGYRQTTIYRFTVQP
jgi:aldose 1-epimerase